MQNYESSAGFNLCPCNSCEDCIKPDLLLGSNPKGLKICDSLGFSNFFLAAFQLKVVMSFTHCIKKTFEPFVLLWPLLLILYKIRGCAFHITQILLEVVKEMVNVEVKHC